MYGVMGCTVFHDIEHPTIGPDTCTLRCIISVVEAGRQLSSSHLFASETALAVLVRSVQQMCSTRLGLSTDLLMLLTLMCHLGDQVLNFRENVVNVCL